MSSSKASAAGAESVKFAVEAAEFKGGGLQQAIEQLEALERAARNANSALSGQRAKPMAAGEFEAEVKRLANAQKIAAKDGKLSTESLIQQMAELRKYGVTVSGVVESLKRLDDAKNALSKKTSLQTGDLRVQGVPNMAKIAYDAYRKAFAAEQQATGNAFKTLMDSTTRPTVRDVHGEGHGTIDASKVQLGVDGPIKLIIPASQVQAVLEGVVQVNAGSAASGAGVKTSVPGAAGGDGTTSADTARGKSQKKKSVSSARQPNSKGPMAEQTTEFDAEGGATSKTVKAYAGKGSTRTTKYVPNEAGDDWEEQSSRLRELGFVKQMKDLADARRSRMATLAADSAANPSGRATALRTAAKNLSSDAARHLAGVPDDEAATLKAVIAAQGRRWEGMATQLEQRASLQSSLTAARRARDTTPVSSPNREVDYQIAQALAYQKHGDESRHLAALDRAEKAAAKRDRHEFAQQASAIKNSWMTRAAAARRSGDKQGEQASKRDYYDQLSAHFNRAGGDPALALRFHHKARMEDANLKIVQEKGDVSRVQRQLNQQLLGLQEQQALAPRSMVDYHYDRARLYKSAADVTHGAVSEEHSRNMLRAYEDSVKAHDKATKAAEKSSKAQEKADEKKRKQGIHENDGQPTGMLDRLFPALSGGNGGWLNRGLSGWTPSGYAKNLLTVGGWGMAAQTAMAGFDFVKHSVQRASDLEVQLARLRQIFREVGGSAVQLTSDVLKLAAAEGRGGEEAMQAAVQWSRLGLSRQQVAAATRVSLMAANVSEMSADEATQNLSAIMATYKLRVSDLEPVLGMLNQTSNTNRVTVGDLLGGMGRSAAVAAQVGMPLAQLQGHIGGIVSATGQTGVMAGNAVKSILTALATPDIQEALRRGAGIDVAGPGDTGVDIGKLWQGYQRLDQNRQKQVGILVAGRTQAARFDALMASYPEARRMEIEGLLSPDSAAQENQRIKSTMRGQWSALGAEWDRSLSTPQARGAAAWWSRQLSTGAAALGGLNDWLESGSGSGAVAEGTKFAPRDPSRNLTAYKYYSPSLGTPAGWYRNTSAGGAWSNREGKWQAVPGAEGPSFMDAAIYRNIKMKQQLGIALSNSDRKFVASYEARVAAAAAFRPDQGSHYELPAGVDLSMAMRSGVAGVEAGAAGLVVSQNKAQGLQSAANWLKDMSGQLSAATPDANLALMKKGLSTKGGVMFTEDQRAELGRLADAGKWDDVRAKFSERAAQAQQEATRLIEENTNKERELLKEIDGQIAAAKDAKKSSAEIALLEKQRENIHTNSRQYNAQIEDLNIERYAIRRGQYDALHSATMDVGHRLFGQFQSPHPVVQEMQNQLRSRALIDVLQQQYDAMTGLGAGGRGAAGGADRGLPIGDPRMKTLKEQIYSLKADTDSNDNPADNLGVSAMRLSGAALHFRRGIFSQFAGLEAGADAVGLTEGEQMLNLRAGLSRRLGRLPAGPLSDDDASRAQAWGGELLKTELGLMERKLALVREEKQLRIEINHQQGKAMLLGTPQDMLTRLSVGQMRNRGLLNSPGAIMALSQREKAIWWESGGGDPMYRLKRDKRALTGVDASPEAALAAGGRYITDSGRWMSAHAAGNRAVMMPGGAGGDGLGELGAIARNAGTQVASLATAATAAAAALNRIVSTLSGGGNGGGGGSPAAASAPAPARASAPAAAPAPRSAMPGINTGSSLGGSARTAPAVDRSNTVPIGSAWNVVPRGQAHMAPEPQMGTASYDQYAASARSRADASVAAQAAHGAAERARADASVASQAQHAAMERGYANMNAELNGYRPDPWE